MLLLAGTCNEYIWIIPRASYKHDKRRSYELANYLKMSFPCDVLGGKGVGKRVPFEISKAKTTYRFRVVEDA